MIFSTPRVFIRTVCCLILAFDRAFGAEKNQTKQADYDNYSCDVLMFCFENIVKKMVSKPQQHVLTLL